MPSPEVPAGRPVSLETGPRGADDLLEVPASFLRRCHDHHGHHHDLDLLGAYLHVLADAATSLFAIVALFGGKLWGAAWLDPVMGLVGAALVSVWAYGLLRDSGRALLDAEMDAPVVAEVREVVAGLPATAEIADLHVWRVGNGKYACILALVMPDPVTPEAVRRALAVHDELVHVTVAVNPAPPAPAAAVSSAQDAERGWLRCSRWAQRRRSRSRRLRSIGQPLILRKPHRAGKHRCRGASARIQQSICRRR